ncbi:MAG: DPP IV N-terminal domain-containing protein [Chloroflexi bacterium]|nr:DPP IV N-terminal domain-containing protein [Chloroflexota bacterium]
MRLHKLVGSFFLFSLLIVGLTNPSESKAFQDNNIGPRRPDWSPDGEQIVFSSFVGGDIWIVDADGQNLQNLTEEFDSSDDFAVWSPYGEQIFFVSDRDGSIDIWVMEADGSDSENLTGSLEVAEGYYSVSPDGSRVAFTAYSDDTETTSIWIVDVGSKELEQISPDYLDSFSLPTWSPDGSQLAFQRDIEGMTVSEIWTISLDPFHERIITTEQLEGPFWSPADDNTVGYLSQQDCDRGFNISIFDLEEDASVQMTEDCVATLHPLVWSHDGNHIAFTGIFPETMDWNIMVLDMESGELIDLTSFSGEWDYDPTWSPDDTQIAFISNLATGDLWVINADGSSPRKLTP